MKQLTNGQICNACISYRHDFGLMGKEDRDRLVFEAREWARAFNLTGEAHPAERCRHGVWAGDHCFQCEREAQPTDGRCDHHACLYPACDCEAQPAAGTVVNLPNRVVDVLAQEVGYSFVPCQNFYDFAQNVKNEVLARIPPTRHKVDDKAGGDENEHLAFKTWARTRPWIKDTQRHDAGDRKGQYGHWDTMKAWEAWSARAALYTRPQPQAESSRHGKAFAPADREVVFPGDPIEAPDTGLLDAAKEAEAKYKATFDHLMDVYEKLGVRWGDDPFAAIAKKERGAT